MQLLTALFLLGAGCATTPPPGLDLLPEGLYVFDAPIFYETGMAELTHTPRGVRVRLLENDIGAFTLRPDARGRLDIVDDAIDYRDLKRKLNGSGRITKPGRAEGKAKVWLMGLGPVSRNHRKGTWTLRRATPEESQRHRAKERSRELREQRAREGGLDI